MIVKSGREFIVNNGLTNYLGNLRVYLGTETNMVDPEAQIKANEQEITFKDEQKELIPITVITDTNKEIIQEIKEHNETIKGIFIDKREVTDIVIYIINYPLGNTMNSVSSISFTITVPNSDDTSTTTECLLSRVTFPARTVNSATSLSFEYHLYF